MDAHQPRNARHRRLTREEIGLWTEVTRTIKARRGALIPEPTSPPMTAVVNPSPPSASKVSRTSPRSTPDLPQKTIPPLVPVEKRLRQKLSRGKVDVQMKIDLHGMRQEEAHHALGHFLNRAYDRECQIVLVVTGKGKTKLAHQSIAFEPGVLRRLVPHWLAAPDLRKIILGFEEAAASHGGSGALYVRIRRHRDRGLETP